MKCTSEARVQEQEDIKFPCLMELVKGPNEESTGLVVLMVEKEKGMIVSITSERHSFPSNYVKGYWSNNWHQRTKHDKDSGSECFWASWAGTITLEND